MDSEHCRPIKIKRIIFVTLLTFRVKYDPALVKIYLFILKINLTVYLHAA